VRRLAAALALVSPLAALAGLPPRYGGGLELALPESPAELDPASILTASELEAARALQATLVEAEPGGSLRPGLLAALPEPEPGGRVWRLRLRPGLRFHDGRPVTAADVAASLSRLLAPQTRSAHGWIALPVSGADEVREGRVALLPGVQVQGELELRIALDAPFLDFPRALAALPAAVVPRGGAPGDGAGPFRLASRDGEALRLLAFDGYYRGRSYADSLSLAGEDARRASRGFARGELELALRPEGVPGAEVRELPPSTATYALVNARRLGPLAQDLRGVLSGLNRAELAHLAGRGPSTPLAALLPQPLLPAPLAAPPARVPGRIGGNPKLVLLVASGPEGNRALADRLQVKLFDRGVRAAVEAVAPAALLARLASGAYEVALVSLTFTSSGAGPALLECAWTLGGPAAARRALARLGSADAAAAAAEVAEDLGAVPLFASGLRASSRKDLSGLEVLPDGTVDPGDLWLGPERTSPERPR